MTAKINNMNRYTTRASKFDSHAIFSYTNTHAQNMQGTPETCMGWTTQIEAIKVIKKKLLQVQTKSWRCWGHLRVRREGPSFMPESDDSWEPWGAEMGKSRFHAARKSPRSSVGASRSWESTKAGLRRSIVMLSCRPAMSTTKYFSFRSSTRKGPS